MVWQAVEAVLVIFLMISAGIFVSWKKWVSRETANVFSKLVIYVTLPCTVINNFMTHFSKSELQGAWLPLVTIFAVMPITFIVGRLFAKLFRIPETKRGVFTVLFSFSNSVFIGFPVAEALFGEAGMPYAVYFYLANTTFFWLLGYYAIRKDADILSGNHSKVSVKEIAGKLATPPIITILIMFVVVLLGLRLPDMIISTARYIGGMTSPLSLMFMGCMIYSVGIKGMKYEKGVGPMMFGRFLLIPAICFSVITLVISLTAPQGPSAEMVMMRNVFTVQSGLPVMTQTVIVAELYGADVKYATKSVVWTTVASLLTIPAYMVLFQYI